MDSDQSGMPLPYNSRTVYPMKYWSTGSSIMYDAREPCEEEVKKESGFWKWWTICSGVFQIILMAVAIFAAQRTNQLFFIYALIPIAMVHTFGIIANAKSHLSCQRIYLILAALLSLVYVFMLCACSVDRTPFGSLYRQVNQKQRKNTMVVWVVLFFIDSVALIPRYHFYISCNRLFKEKMVLSAKATESNRI